LPRGPQLAFFECPAEIEANRACHRSAGANMLGIVGIGAEIEYLPYVWRTYSP
jgi:hypothetical protein